MTSSEATKKIGLKTSDGEVFEVDYEVACESLTLKAYFDEECAAKDNVIPLPIVSGRALSKIIVYCRKHLDLRVRSSAPGEEQAVEKEGMDFDREFVRELSDDELKELIVAANYLNMKEFLDMLNQGTADRIKNKSVAYVRAFFGIENDFTPEEEARIREENLWAFEGVEED
ncbi:SKP1-like protein 1A [Tripterygium wilfordii]|uniref:SKP1-like protein 1A n=1 Tax=Tripterygium wilfordii TaxID=458696 RepID=UPI0018F7EEF0|nr:SKP1-like protein 1A [Tripterygium wilfordii]